MTNSNFMEALQNQVKDDHNVSVTENGAIGFATTNQPLVDLHYRITSFRGTSINQQADFFNLFEEAYKIDKDTALKWLFYVRDVREGLGEKDVFRYIIQILGIKYPEALIPLIRLIPEYGRWDDLFVLLKTPLSDSVLTVISMQLRSDIEVVNEYMKTGETSPISLLGKWLPSINSHNSENRMNAKVIANYLGLWLKDYRIMCSNLRTYIDVVEKKMTANRWHDIDYSAVPSKAALLYGKAFLRHDMEGYSQYLKDVREGNEKINAGTLNPHEIVMKYRENIVDNDLRFIGTVDNKTIDPLLENLWSALPNTIGSNNANILMIRDGSRSMVLNHVGKSNATALDVSTALTIYFAERTHGEFHNKFITFSKYPDIIDLDGCELLYDKLHACYQHQDYTNTNIEAVFQLILRIAIDSNMSQDDFPEALVIVSDGEFDNMVNTYSSRGVDIKLFESISDQFKRNGYKMPKLIFWNVCGRTNTIPMKTNEMGCILMSGFSVHTMKMLMNGCTSPYEALLYELSRERYHDIRTCENPEKIIENPLADFIKKNGTQFFTDQCPHHIN